MGRELGVAGKWSTGPRALTVAILVALTGLVGPPRSYAATHQIPAVIPSDCSIDVTLLIRTWIASVPDNSTLAFGSGACYRVDGILELTNRNGLTFEGNGATLRAFIAGDPQRAHWRLVGGSNLVLRNMTIRGAHPNPGTSVPELQWQHGIDLRGVAGVEVDRVNVVNPYGDCFYVGRAWDAAAPWTRNALVHDSSCEGAGRQGISVTAGRDVVAERISLRQVALNAFDVEPNGTGSGAENVAFRNSQVTAPLGHNFAVAVGSGPVNGVTVANNTLVGKGMYMAFLAPVGERRSNITITGNSSDTGHYAPGSTAIDFQRVDGVTVSGNTIPLSGPNMAVVWASESCNVNVSGNSFPGGLVEARISPYSVCPTSIANQPPTVDLTAPVEGAVFSSSLAISAKALDDKGVTKVEFRAGGTLLATDSSAPYSYNWSPNKRKAAYGDYTITAKAFDGSGLSQSDSATVTRLPGTSTTLRVSGTGASASSKGVHRKRARGRVKGSRSGRVAIRLERYDRTTHEWVQVRTRKLQIRHGRFATRLSRPGSGRWRARAEFRGTRKRAPSVSPYRYF